LSTRGKETSELLIDGKHAEFIAQQHQWIAVRKGCPSDAGRFLRDGRGCLRMERHGGGLLLLRSSHLLLERKEYTASRPILKRRGSSSQGIFSVTCPWQFANTIIISGKAYAKRAV
jgi:hypothetical protein